MTHVWYDRWYRGSKVDSTSDIGTGIEQGLICKESFKKNDTNARKYLEMLIKLNKTEQTHNII